MPSVLIVDDEPNIRRMVGALLSAEGYEVREAPDGRSGIVAYCVRIFVIFASRSVVHSPLDAAR